MSDHIDRKVWLIGSGLMALEYAKVLQKLDVPIEVVGRGEASANRFTEITGLPVRTGGLDSWLQSTDEIPQAAIVAVNVEKLASTTLLLLRKGVKKILVEKPAGLTTEEIAEVNEASIRHNAKVYVAYNRRFYASTRKAKEIIAEDGGVLSFQFEFTEWSHVIQDLDKPVEVKHQWFLANSTHVADLAFFLGGKPKTICSFTGGSLPWHPSASLFAGAGTTERNALFTYHANWEAPGRWGVEVLTRSHRLYFRPMEQLHIQKIGSVDIHRVEIDDTLDQLYKPGLYLQTVEFLGDRGVDLLTITEQHEIAESVYSSIVTGRNRP